jgi:hypothetical protein
MKKRARTKIIIFQKITFAKNAFLRAELHLKFSDQLIEPLTGGEIFFLKMGHVGYQNVRLFA